MSSGTRERKGRVLFVHPCLEENRAFTVRAKREHLGIGYLLGVLRKAGYSADVVDGDILDLSVEELTSEVLERRPLVLGIALSSQRLVPQVLDLVARFREGGGEGHVVLGGHFPTLAHDLILAESAGIDSVIRGEAESTIVELCRRILAQESLEGLQGVTFRRGDRLVTSADSVLVADLDGIPFPDRDTLPLILETGQRAAILSSRGCYGSCTFCTQRAFYGTLGWRPRSPSLVVDEVGRLVGEHGVTRLRFYDDNFIGPGSRGRDHAAEICDLLLERKIDVDFEIYCRANDIEFDLFALLKEAGCSAVTCGIESGSDSFLRRVRKGTKVARNLKAIDTLRSLGIRLKSAFVMFDPYTKLEDIINNIEMLEYISETDPFNLVFFSDEELLPYFGTPFRRHLIEDGLYRADRWFDVGSYGFLDSRVEDLFSMVMELRPLTTALQRRWVELSLALSNPRISDARRQEVRAMMGELEQVAGRNIRRLIDVAKMGVFDTYVIEDLRQDMTKILDKCAEGLKSERMSASC